MRRHVDKNRTKREIACVRGAALSSKVPKAGAVDQICDRTGKTVMQQRPFSSVRDVLVVAGFCRRHVGTCQNVHEVLLLYGEGRRVNR